MKADHGTLEDRLNYYEGELKSLRSYVKELNDRAAEHGTEKEHYATDLIEAEHNIKYYEGEIALIKEVIEKGPEGGAAFIVYQDASREWRWQLRAGNQRIIADSGEGYRDKQHCLHAIALVKDLNDAPVKEKGKQ